MRRRYLALLLVALSLVAGSCSKDAKTGSPGGVDAGASIVLLAAQKTISAGSSKVAMAANFAADGQQFAMTGDGAFDFSAQTGLLNFKVSGDEIPEAFSGFEIRFIRDTLYMKFPKEFSQVAPGLKQWVRADLKELAKQQGLNLPGLNSFAGQDPTSALNFTRGATNIKQIGTEQVRGARTTRFSMTVDLKKAIESFPEESRGGFEKMFETAGITELPMELWVDGDGRARRLRFEIDLAKLAKSAGSDANLGSGTAAISIDLYEFGTPVSVAAPPANQVSDFSELSRL